MARKPYVAQQPDNWYTKSEFYQKYMLRELTCIPVMLAALNLFWCLTTLATAPEHWIVWVEFQRSAIGIIFNILAIVAALFNTVEWFKAMPKAMPIQIGEKFVEDKKMIGGSWAAFAVITAIVFVVIMALF